MSSGKTFEYGGHHFTPVRQFQKKEGDFFALSKRIESDPELGFSEYEQRQKFPYRYKEFYAVSTDRTCDIFRCEENGRLYVPASRELFIYHDPFHRDAMKESFTHAHLLEENVLFTTARLDRSTVPDNLFVYELGYSVDEDIPDRMASTIGKNFYGTVVSEISYKGGDGQRLLDVEAYDFFFDSDHIDDTFSIRDFPEIYPKESVLAVLKDKVPCAGKSISERQQKKEPEHGR